MNVIKHMEAAFLFSLTVAAGALAVDAIPPARAAVAATPTVVENSIATSSATAVVKISAKRMSAAEKQQSLARERIALARA